MADNCVKVLTALGMHSNNIQLSKRQIRSCLLILRRHAGSPLLWPGHCQTPNFPTPQSKSKDSTNVGELYLPSPSHSLKSDSNGVYHNPEWPQQDLENSTEKCVNSSFSDCQENFAVKMKQLYASFLM